MLLTKPSTADVDSEASKQMNGLDAGRGRGILLAYPLHFAAWTASLVTKPFLL
jgi:hypothetical protein